MRTIKFRAWDRTKKKMVKEGFFINSFGNPVAWIKGELVEAFEPMNYELMQFTGLKDKNGKEIYEGDILMETDNAGYIHWNGAGAYYQLIEVGKNGCPDFEGIDGIMPKLGIIGNIWENPELLK